MNRNKATFRAMRETLGLTQQSLADRLNVKVLSVKRWEMPKYPQQAPNRVWQLLEDLQTVQDAHVSKATETGADDVTLPYWMSAQDFTDFAGESEPAETWTEANATRRAIAQALREDGHNVTWHDAVTGD